MDNLILTCEHAGNEVPRAHAELFRGHKHVLDSHRGWDPGALQLARTFEQRLQAPLFHTTITRLLVETNRSLRHPRLFSEFSKSLDRASRQAILDGYYHAHRSQVEAWIGMKVEQGFQLVHVALHSFAPQLNGHVRKADVGLLYDPRRKSERALCGHWHAALAELRPDLRIRRNYPYRGNSDGLTTHLRKEFSGRQYAGIELEVNQAWPLAGGTRWRQLQRDLADSFATACNPR